MTSKGASLLEAIEVVANPFPGLRPFEFSESHLFFGRDGQIEKLLEKLLLTRFLAVVGSSGSGKSSLVRAGLIPALRGGMMGNAGTNWRVAIMRPSNDPIGNLALALNAADVFGSENPKELEFQIEVCKATLRLGSRGLIEAIGQTPIPDNENVLIVIDQFEELFRFARESQREKADQADDDAAAFVKLFLEAINPSVESEIASRIFVTLTMRSDYLGDCARFWNLPEAISDSQYLIPRLSREQIREAIIGPIRIGGAEATPRLINRLLNDMGDNFDHLPILQHALLRIWDEWRQRTLSLKLDGTEIPHSEAHRGEAIDLCCFEAIGTMTDALSIHAEEAYAGFPDDRQRAVTEKIFKSLTERGADQRDIRRPVTLEELRQIAEADLSEVIQVVETFRAPGRSFLLPPIGTDLKPESLIDISHEALMRHWRRLNNWVREEAKSARVYRRLAETARLHQKGEAGLWRDPDLQLALMWRETARPNEHWALRYDTAYREAISFLEKSEVQRRADSEAAERQRLEESERRMRELEQAKLLEAEKKRRIEAEQKHLELERKLALATTQKRQERAELEELSRGARAEQNAGITDDFDLVEKWRRRAAGQANAGSEAYWDVEEFTRSLAEAVVSWQKNFTAEMCDTLISHLRDRPDPYPEKSAKRILQILRSKRYFDLMRQVADAFIQSGQSSFAIRRLYSQALLDQGAMTAAIDVLDRLAADAGDDPYEQSEIRGLIGRAYKQLYVDAGPPRLLRNQTYLLNAINAYHRVFLANRRNIWHGINTVALLFRSIRDGVRLTEFPNAAELATATAEDILKSIVSLDKEASADFWDFATAVEACIALNRPDEAMWWLARYVGSSHADAFELAGTLRQYVEIWRLDRESELGRRILPVLHSELLKREGGVVELNPSELRAEEQVEIRPSKTFGEDSFVSLDWYKAGLERCRAIAMIRGESGRAIGSGFLLKGSDLHKSLGEGLVLLTAAHVISDSPEAFGALRPDRAFVSFNALGIERVGINELIWTSPPSELDTTILRLDRPIDEVHSYPIATWLPTIDGSQRVYVVGNLGGERVSFSLHDNLLLAHNDYFIHYRTSTETGVSGSPVFNQKWELIGMHHKGGALTLRIDGRPGVYSAHEGIWIGAIKTAIAESMGGAGADF
jgi:hypothetical protein